MSQQNHSHSIELTGEVVEIFERDAEKIVKLSLHPQCVDVPLPGSLDPHLGEEVRLEMTVSPDRGELIISSGEDRPSRFE